MSTNILPEHIGAFEALTSGEHDKFAPFFCFLDGATSVVIVAVMSPEVQGGKYHITPLFVVSRKAWCSQITMEPSPDRTLFGVGHPVFTAMPHADDQDVRPIYLVNNNVGFVWVHTNWRNDLQALARHSGIGRQEIKQLEQSLMISLSLFDAEFFNADHRD